MGPGLAGSLSQDYGEVEHHTLEHKAQRDCYLIAEKKQRGKDRDTRDQIYIFKEISVMTCLSNYALPRHNFIINSSMIHLIGTLYSDLSRDGVTGVTFFLIEYIVTNCC